MIQTLNFDDEGLIVNWLSFKIESLNTFNQDRLADYLVQNGFNSYLQSRKAKSKEILRSHPMNSFEVVFLKDISYWKGTILQFSGINPREFYNWLKQEETLNWKLFQNPILSRFDLYYTLETPVTEEETQSFFNNCQKNSQLNLEYTRNKRGHSLKIGRRISDRFSQIYNQKNQLRFEHEMKGKFIEEYSHMFIDRRWEDFEHLISQYFLQSFKKHLPIDSVYLNWLSDKLQSIRPEPVANLHFKMNYVDSIDKVEDQKKAVNFLKFLVYAKDLEYVTQSLGSTQYRSISFRVQDFLRFQDPSFGQGSKYKIQKVAKFFNELQTSFLISRVGKNVFQSLRPIPKIQVWREGHQFWRINVWIVDELFYYADPVSFPNLFDPKSSNRFLLPEELNFLDSKES